MSVHDKIENKELVHKCFYYLNSFKRHRALANITRSEGNIEKSKYHELKQYHFLDNLELALRAVQKGVRELADAEDE